MAFCGQMQDRVRLGLGEYLVDGFAIGNVGAHEAVAGHAVDRGEGSPACRIGQFVDVDDGPAASVNQMPAQGRADKTGATGHENTHGSLPLTRRHRTRSLLRSPAASRPHLGK